jgi:hypothetical protein
VYRSIDGGTTAVAMAVPSTGIDVNWIIEDPAVENSVFVACGADILNATDPTLGWALLYPGPVGAIARQFVRSQDGQVTWVCYLNAPSGQAAQRVETGAFADVAVTDIRTLALDNAASALAATLTLIDSADPAAIYHVDGLTGLSAATSPATFPAGATVMHLLADPDAPVYYAADFDSVEVGTGAVRKLVADQLLLMRAGETGQQAHMLGFGGPVVVPVVADLLMVGGGLMGGTGVGRWNNATQSWDNVSGDLPVRSWEGVVASPLNVVHWIVWGDDLMYRTTNAGVHWEQITGVGGIRSGLTIQQVEFSPTTVNHWAMATWAFDTGSAVNLGVVQRGIDNAATETTEWIASGGPLHLPIDQAMPSGLVYTTSDDLIVSIMHDPNPLYGDKWVRFSGTLSGLGTVLGPVNTTVHLLDGIPGSVPALGVGTDPSDTIGQLWSPTWDCRACGDRRSGHDRGHP